VATQATARPRNPLRTFQFRVRVTSFGKNEGTTEYVAGCRSVSGLNLHVTPFEIWEGGNNLHRYANPNKVNWDPVVLEQGLALDDTLELWADAVVEFARTNKRPRLALKRQVTIDVWDPYVFGPDAPATPGAHCRRYTLHNAWISKYHPLPKLDATASEVALLQVELVHEGWELENPPTASVAPPGDVQI
jgi:phage tail-like protein